MKKRIIVTLLILLYISLFGFYLYKNYKSEVMINLNAQNINIEYGDEYIIDKNSYIQNILFIENDLNLSKEDIYSYIELDLSQLEYEDKLNYLKVGEYVLNFNLIHLNPQINLYFKNNAKTNSIKITVQDTTKPSVNLINSQLNWKKGEQISNDDILNCLEIYDLSSIRVEFDLKTININKLGKQKLNINVLDNYNNKNEVVLTINIVDNISKSKTIFNNDGKIDNFTFIKASYIYNRFPDKIKQIIENNGWTYYITDKNINGTYYEGDLSGILAGVTIHSKKTVYIHKDYLYEGLLHECGHVLDLELGGLSSSNEFKSIVDSEKEAFASFDNTINEYYLSSYSELFAESVEIMIESPSQLKNKCPFLYHYMYQIIYNE